MGADRDDDGAFVLGGAPVTHGLDPSEIIVPDETVYYVGDRECRLAEGLGTTSHGLRVKVF
jgi:hypothetical protein